MTGSEYVERALSVMKYANAKEREAIRAELSAHIEDHICDLLELDYPQDLAEERTMALMGDPEEVGRELDRHYEPTLWDALEGIAKVLLVVMILQGLLGVGILFHAVDSMEARFAPEARRSSEDFRAEVREETDYRMAVGNDIVKVYQVSVGHMVFSRHANDEIVEQGPAAELQLCAYDRVPFGIVSGALPGRIEAADQRGEKIERWGGSAGSWGAGYDRLYIPVEPGDTYVTLSYDRFGESVTLKVPLPEVTP